MERIAREKVKKEVNRGKAITRIWKENLKSRKALKGVDIDISLEDFKEKNDEDAE